MRLTRSERIFQYFNNIILLGFSLCMLLPLWHVFMYSISDPNKSVGVDTFLYPHGFSLDAYRIVLKNPLILSAYRNTLYIVIAGTILNLLMTFLMAYALAKENLRGKQILTFFLFFTMIFNGGLIPTYMVVKAIGLINSLNALIVPNAVNAFFIFILRTFIRTIPVSLFDSAKIDGANELTILFKLVVPLSMPALVVIGLMYGVGNWNSWFNAVMYINDLDKMPLQPILRQLLFVMDSVEFFKSSPDVGITGSNLPQIVKMATVMVATLPILMVYPFLQRHFVKGIMLGAIKG